MLRLIHDFEALSCEQVYITSKDGLLLHGRYYHTKDGAPLQIQCHGYRGTAMRDYCGGSKLGKAAGHNLLVIDQRAHGKSQGNVISFGIKERFDCLSWIEYALERFGNNTEIILCGVSMGAATVLMCSDMELPANVKGILADCPYSCPVKIIRKVCKDEHLPPALTMPFIHLAARIFGRFKLDEHSPEKAVINSKLPILIIHGEDDRFVPCQMSRDLAALTDKIRLETFPNAGHGLSFIEDFERYKFICNEFFDSILVNKNQSI